MWEFAKLEKNQKYYDNIFSVLFGDSDDILIIVDKAGKILKANTKFLKGNYFEIADPENPGELMGYFNSSEREIISKEFKHVFQNKSTHPSTITIHSVKNQTFYFERSYSILDENTCLVRFKDISTQVFLKDEIKEMEEYKDYFRQSSKIIIIIIDNNNCIKGWNKGSEKILGYKKEDVLGSDKIWNNLFPNQNIRKKALNAFKDDSLLSGEKVFTVTSKDSDEKIINFFRQKLCRPDNSVLGSIIMGLDITDRVNAENKLISNEKKYKQLVNLLPEVIFEVDTKGNILFVNQRAFKIFGYKEEDYKKGLNVIQMIAPSDIKKAKENISKFLKGEISGKGNEYLAITKQGKTFPVLIFNELITENKKIVGLRGIIIDISERKNYENYLKSAKEKAEESDRIKSTFLANMSHEIRTPMNGIMGFAELLKDPNLAYHERRQFLDIITNSGNHLLNLINDIIDISKIEAGQLLIDKEDFSINALLKDVHSFFQTEIETKEQDLKLVLKNDLPDDKSFIYTDSVRLRQILNNLIANAIKFTKIGKVEFGYNIREGNMEFFVKDSGIGLSKDQIKIVFERFTQAENKIERKYGGTGLGLAICKGVVELLGGRIWVKSEENKGAEFYFDIPYAPTTMIAAEINNKDLIQDVDWSNKHILIAEDDDASYELLKALLGRTKVNVTRVKNGMDAVETYKNNKDYDLVLMDILLPRLNGIEATKQLKKIKESVPVIAQTANAMIQHKRDCLKAGCDDYITKPIDYVTLITTLKSYLS